MFRRLSLTTAMVMLWSLLSLAETPAYATPMSWGDRITVSLKWPKGTLKVYVQPDPKGLSRDTLVKEGIDRWKKAFGDRGITLDVSIGNPPANAVKPIRYTWEADGVEEAGKKLGAENDAIAWANGAPTGGGKGEMLSGTAQMRNALPVATEADRNYVKNLAEHEFVHILGLADEEDGAVTKHEQGSNPRTLSDLDVKELNSLYGTAQTGGSQAPHGRVERFAGGANDGSGITASRWTRRTLCRASRIRSTCRSSPSRSTPAW